MRNRSTKTDLELKFFFPIKLQYIQRTTNTTEWFKVFLEKKFLKTKSQDELEK